MEVDLRTGVYLVTQIATAVSVVVALVVTVRHLKGTIVELTHWIRQIEKESRADIKALDLRVDGLDIRQSVMEAICGVNHGNKHSLRTQNALEELLESARPQQDPDQQETNK